MRLLYSISFYSGILLTITNELFRLSFFFFTSKNCDTDCDVILLGFSGTYA